jgi:hypothetical protein
MELVAVRLEPLLPAHKPTQNFHRVDNSRQQTEQAHHSGFGLWRVESATMSAGPRTH